MVRGPKRPTVVLLASVVTLVGVAAPAGTSLPAAPAVARAAKKAGPVDRAVGVLQAAQNADGGVGTTAAATTSDPSTTVWSALALAAVGIHPDDQPGKGRTLLDYIESRGPQLQDTGDIARAVLVLAAAGRLDTPPAKALLQNLTARQGAAGAFADAPGGTFGVEATSFAVLALVAATPNGSSAAAVAGAAWLKTAHDGRGWGLRARTAARPDMTGLAMQALRAAEPKEFELSSDAERFLHDRGNGDGGFGAASRTRSDARATAWAMQGLRAIDRDPATFTTLSGASAGSFLESRQHADGSFGGVLRTAEVLAGLNGTAFPAKAPKRGNPLASSGAAGDGRPNAARGGGKGGDGALNDARADADPNAKDGRASTSDGDTDDGGDDGSSGASPGGGTSTPSDGGLVPAAPAPTPTPTPAPAPETDPAPAATTPKPAAAAGGEDDASDAPADAGAQQVDGVVVGAERAAATTPTVATGAGGPDRRWTSALAALLVAVVAIGTQIERRRPKGIVS